MELTIEQVLQQGITAHQEGKLQEAERLYRLILQTQPQHPDANHNLGLIAVSVDQADAALPLLKTALEASPKIEQFWLSYIDVLIKENQLETANAVLKQGRKMGLVGDKVDTLEAKLKQVMESALPKLPEQKKSLTLKEKRKRIAESKQQKKQTKGKSANGISPSQSQLDNLVEYYQNARYDEAEKLAVTITQQFPKHPFGWKVLGAVLKQTGRVGESLVANQKSVQLAPQDAEAHFNLGNTLQELNRLDEAEASYNQATALKPDYAEAHNNLGITLQELDRLDEAKASYTQAIAFKPDYAEAHNNLGITLKVLSRLDEAEASYNQAITLKPDFAEAHSNLGITLQELGRLNEAEASYTRAIALKADYAEAHFNLGITLQELSRLEEAEASYNQALALKPDYAEAHNNLGITLKVLGRLEGAEASYNQALALKPDFAEAHRNLGGALYALGRLEEAAASYTQAIALKPDNLSAKHMLAALTGETTATAPLAYVEGLFDNYAVQFESSLVDDLEYKIPKIIVQMLLKNHKGNSLGSVLDLGCGTGLAGVEIKPYCEYLEGIDLSKKMLKEASQKNAYDKLVHLGIEEYLASANLDFEYFISTDVFVYVGDLSETFRLIKSRNKTGGKLVFSVEDYNGDGFFLEQSGRYSHSKQYITSLCEEFGYTLSRLQNANIRKERDRYIKGCLYLLDF